MSSNTVALEPFKRFEREGWEAKADGYHRFFSQVTHHNVEPLLDAAHVVPGVRLLDVGCGPGSLAAAAAARGAVAAGVDMAEAMVRLAQRLHPGIEFRHGLADALPFPDETFRAVVGNLLLPHLPSPEADLQALTRVLCRGGHLALSMWGVPAENRFMGIIVDAVAEVKAPPAPGVPPGPPTFRFAVDAELRRLFEGAGLDQVEVRTIAFRQPVKNADALWEAMLKGTVRTASLVAGQSDEVRQRIRSAFDRIANAYRDGDVLQIPVSFKIASGRKPA